MINVYRIAVIVGILAFTIWCFLCDWDNVSGASDNILIVICRLIARHIKLFTKLAVGLILSLGAIGAILKMNASKSGSPSPNGGGPQSEQLAGFINQVTAPVQWLWNGFIGILGLLAFAAVAGMSWISDSIKANPQAWGIAAFVIYMIWLVVTVLNLVEDEMTGTREKPATKSTTVIWSLVTLAAWALIVCSIPYAIGFTARLLT